ncbi:hypothetical protein CERSUDRAFT_111493 [Gelatoporia subvermispora B]|uniref:Uncharacterized protein n=1 Tax=Ceriporiopsis subvermispora (strain B) TaxID=914234 RepID=M2RR36_CERS8|nr:hypothetical protein CERSUDRAFT_111493 [Gelatoporia subvermispora B]
MKPPDRGDMQANVAGDVDLRSLHDQLLALASLIMRAQPSAKSDDVHMTGALASLEQRVAALEAEVTELRKEMAGEARTNTSRQNGGAWDTISQQTSPQYQSDDTTLTEDEEEVAFRELKSFSEMAAKAVHQHDPPAHAEGTEPATVNGSEDERTPRFATRTMSLDSDSTLCDSITATLETKQTRDELKKSTGKYTEAASMNHDIQPATNNMDWSIEFHRVPATAPVSSGRWLLDHLVEFLGLDEDTISSIERLEALRGPGMRLHVELNILFIRDPIILESSDMAYLIDWAPKRGNVKAIQYLTNGTFQPVARHVFMFRSHMDGWYYVGLYIISPVNVDDWNWRKLGGKDMFALADELRKRWGNDMRRADIMSMLEKGEVEQCCFELNSDGLEAKTRAFMIDNNFGDPDTVDDAD